jgi:uncharacterized protein
MTRQSKIIAATLAAIGIAVGAGAIAYAQSGGAISAALASGDVGEQADGYLGVRGSISPAVRDEMDAINIKRRAAYTKLAQDRGVTIKEVAAAIGCETLAGRVATGRAYQLPDGVWRVKGTASIALPAYCAN